MRSIEFLEAAIAIQAERGAEYNKDQGERSALALATAFNAITGKDLTEAEVWLMLQLLKDVRQWADPERYHHDSALDGVSYASLKAEALYAAQPKHVPEPVPTMPVEQWQRGDRLRFTGTHRQHFSKGVEYSIVGVTQPGEHFAKIRVAGLREFIGEWSFSSALTEWQWASRP